MYGEGVLKRRKMCERTLVLLRGINVLRIYDEPPNFWKDVFGDIEYSTIYDIVGIKNCGYGLYRVNNKKGIACYVSNVKEVREKW